MARIRYILTTSIGQDILANDPDGWRDDARKIVRDTTMYGILYEYAGQLTFSGDGYDLITAELSRNGHNSTILLERQKTDISDAWVTDYVGELDILTKSETDNTISFKLSEGGLQKSIKAKYSEKYELDRATDLNGNDIGLAPYELITINGRNLLITSELEKAGIINESLQQVLNSRVEIHYTPAIDRTFSGDTSVNGVYPFPNAFYSNIVGEPNLNSTHFFYLKSDQQRQITLNLKYQADVLASGYIEKNFFAVAYIYVYNFDGTNYNFDRVIQLESLNDSSTVSFDIDTTQVITLNEGDCLAFSMNIINTFSSNQTTELVIYDVTQQEFKINIDEDSNADATQCYGISAFNVIDRLTEIITGEKKLVSNVLTDQWKHLYITSGKRIRGFDEPITISLKQAIESLNAIDGISYSIEGQKMRVERLNYFLDRNILMNISIDGITETYNNKQVVNSITVGYKEGGEYEERQGLDEYNVKSTYSYNFTSTDSEDVYESEIRADSYAVEFARRKFITNFPTEDTAYDNDNFFLDCKLDGFLQLRLWNDDFNSLPTGIYSPETAFNLRLSPVQNLFRLSDSFASLVGYQDRYTLFTSSEGNSDLVTDKAERSNVLNSDFKTPLFQPVEVQGQCKLTDQQYNLLKQYPYQLVQYNFKGQNAYGWVKEYDPKSEGQIKLIKANL